jgi:DnaJ-domain-containing protein 1
LRASLKIARQELSEAEEKLSEQLAEVNALERRIRFRLGQSLDELASLETEIEDYQAEITRRRGPKGFEQGYLSVEEQFRRTWETSSSDDGDTFRDPYGDVKPIKQLDQKQIKKLYRRLARRYHPDLASSQREREDRNEQMVALNEAYETGSIVELMVLDDDKDLADFDFSGTNTDNAKLVKALDLELARIRRKTLLIENEIENLHNLPVVRLSLEIKLAKTNGRDLLAEMEVDLKKTIAKKRAERDLLKAQFNQLDAQE